MATKYSTKFDQIRSSEIVQPKVLQYNGQRWSVSDSYHRLNRNEQKILLNAKVMRIILEEIENTSKFHATGIVYLKNGETHEVFATKGVILSAGTVGSPIILQKSGIGPKQLYKQFNNENSSSKIKIRSKVDLPAVGAYLQDHITTGFDLILLNSTIGFEPWQIYSPKQLFNYFWYGKGSLTTTGCESLAFFKTHPTNDSIPDLGFMIVPLGPSHDSSVHLRRIFNINDRSWQNYFKPLIGLKTMTILPIVLHPKSFGTIKIHKTENNLIDFLIDPNYLSNAYDCDILVDGLKLITSLIDTKPFKEIGAYINRRLYPGCEMELFGTTAYWICYIQQLTMTAYHPVGTCRLGIKKNDSVIDSNTFQVHNVKNLFICDASIMPNMPSANPQSTVGMLAMKFIDAFNKNNL